MAENPKLAGSGMVSLRVQRGLCPNGCPFCYYNAAGYYEDRAKPHIPTTDEFQGKLIRVNDGHDANIERDNVLRKTWAMLRLGARAAFMNTSIPRFNFPTEGGGRFPVVFTANGRYPIFARGDLGALMAARVRFDSWGWGAAIALVQYYAARGVPILLTPMRYPAEATDAMPPDEQARNYCFRKHVKNEYWCMVESRQREMAGLLGKQFGARAPVLLCGDGKDDCLCKNCGHCQQLHLWWERRSAT